MMARKHSDAPINSHRQHSQRSNNLRDESIAQAPKIEDDRQRIKSAVRESQLNSESSKFKENKLKQEERKTRNTEKQIGVNVDELRDQFFNSNREVSPLRNED